MMPIKLHACEATDILKSDSQQVLDTSKQRGDATDMLEPANKADRTRYTKSLATNPSKLEHPLTRMYAHSRFSMFGFGQHMIKLLGGN